MCDRIKANRGQTFEDIPTPEARRLPAASPSARPPCAAAHAAPGLTPAYAPPLARGASAGPLRGCAPRACPCGRRGPLPPLRLCGAPPIRAENNGKGFPGGASFLPRLWPVRRLLRLAWKGCEVRHTGHSLPIRRPHIAGQCPATPSIPPMCYRAAPDARGAVMAPKPPKRGMFHAAGGTVNAVSPFSFPPLETPFPDSPFMRITPKGGNRRGTRRGFIHAHATPPFGLPVATPPRDPPLRCRPRWAGALVGRARGSGCRHRAHRFPDGAFAPLSPPGRRKPP